ncbi:MAG: DNA (cytosine-5-)-methyltransferase [Acidobacteria bacterium]|nr:DNA (cytosine-5-)-methyltransferase [Acidobacteriota bacterium]
MRSGTSLKSVGLFAGIGGFELGLAKAGHEITHLCEIDPAAQAVLRKRFDAVKVDEDIRRISRLPKGTELVAAGFPCQDLSQVGQARGMSGEKSGIVSHVFRLLATNRVQWVLLENVPFMLHLDRGAAIHYVTGQLEALGYSWAYRTVDTRSFGLPQRRARVFLLAGLDEDPWRKLFHDGVPSMEARTEKAPPCGFYWTEGNRGIGWAPNAIPTLKGGSGLGIPSPPAIWLRDGSIVTPEIRDAERVQGFAADWTKPAESVGGRGIRWRLVGNAVTTRVSEWLGASLADGYGPEPGGLRALGTRDLWPAAAMGQNGERFEVRASKWPVRRNPKSIEDFLCYEPRALSHKAASGFWQRLKASNLDYPADFARDLKDHIRISQP